MRSLANAVGKFGWGEGGGGLEKYVHINFPNVRNKNSGESPSSSHDHVYRLDCAKRNL